MLGTTRPLQVLARALQSAGVDLLHFGSSELTLFANGVVDQDIAIWPRFDCDSPASIRLINFSYGPNPEDWHFWLSDYTDEFAGEFWDMVENTEPELPIPGAWVD
jgi:hypothetical protein